MAEDSTPTAVPAAPVDEPPKNAPGEPTAADTPVTKPPMATKVPKATRDKQARVPKIPAGTSAAGADARSAVVNSAAATPQPKAARTSTADAPDRRTVQESAPATTTVSVSSVPYTTLVGAQQVSVIAATPQMTAPTTTSDGVSSVVSKALAWVGLSSSLTDSPTAPVGPIESPAMLAALAAWRRQSQHGLAAVRPANVAQTSQNVDPTVTDDLSAAKGQADQQIPADTSTVQFAALVSAVAVANAVVTPPAFVQVNSAVPQTNQSTVATTYTAAQTAGNTNILAIGWNNTTSTITAVTDTAGNTYQLAVPTARGTGLSQAIYYAPNIKAAPAASNTVTVTFNTATRYVDIRATEYSGLDTTNPLDVATSASGTGTTATTGTVTTTAPGLIFSAGMTTGGFSTAGTGFTTRIITNPDADIAQDRTVTTAGAYTATANLGGSASWLMQIATFKATTTGGDTTAPTVAITAPPTGTVTGTITITATATDNVAVSGVQFLVDNNALGAQDTTSPYSTTLNTTTLTNGTHTLTARATDTSANTATSTPVTITVANTLTPTTLVSGLTQPTDFRFLPDGRILIAQKGGAIQVANANGQLQSTLLITLPSDSTGTRGLLGIAVDPNFGTTGNNHVYAVRTLPKDGAGNTYEVLTRITVTDPTAAVLTASPASEVVLVQGIQPGTADHFGGGLSFRP